MKEQIKLVKDCFSLGLFKKNRDLADMFGRSKAWADSIKTGRLKISYQDALLLNQALHNKIRSSLGHNKV
jgi:hypothetical protein